MTSEKCEQKEIFKKQIDDLKNEHKNEIGNLKKEILELKEKLNAKEAESQRVLNRSNIYCSMF